MKLKKIKLLSDFRGLKEDFKINFDTSNLNNDRIEPICFVGLNGSGKSNVLEVLAEMFYYLENLDRSTKSKLKTFKTGFGFELEYYLPKSTLAGIGFTWDQLEDLTFDNLDENQLISIVKKKGELPTIHVSFNDKNIEIKDFYNFGISKILPNHIVGYSSGSNELVSNPFIKLDFQYYNDLKSKSNNESVDSKLENSRFRFLNYEISKLISISIFVFDKGISSVGKSLLNLKSLKTELDVHSLNTFSLNFSLKKPSVKSEYLPFELQKDIQKFKDIDPFFKESIKNGKGSDELKLEFNFTLNEATIEGFRDKFNDAAALFNSLCFFQNLNIEKTSSKTQIRIKEAKAGTRENLSDLIPKFENDKLVFHVDNVSFNKNNIKNSVFYKHLSDGEHQLLQILGSIILLDTQSTLFLLDEPETHFNPAWRSKFIWLVNECLNENKKDNSREQEFLLTTHSPFLVSDSKASNVYFFNKNSNPKTAIELEFNTYGASVDLILQKIFGISHSISEHALEEIRALLRKRTIDPIIEGSKRFGESYEKGFLYERIEELKSIKKKKAK